MMLGLKKQAKQITKLSINLYIFILKLIEENRWTEFAKIEAELEPGFAQHVCID